MVEQLTGQYHEGAQAQQWLYSEIAGFCVGIDNPNTQAAYKRDLRAFFNFTAGVGVNDLTQLTTGLIGKYLQHCKEEQVLSNGTIRRRIASLSSFLVQTGMEEFAKAARDISIKYIGSKPEIQTLHPLSNEEVEKLQGVSRDNPRALAIIAIILGTGATTSEIQALNVNDVLEQASQRVAVRFRGNKPRRQIALDINASEIVRRHKGVREGEEPLFAQRLPIELGEVGLTRQSIWNDVKQYGESIGRPDLSLTVLRQTFIVNVPTNDSKEIARLLGIGERYAGALLKRRGLTQPLPQRGVLFAATAAK